MTDNSERFDNEGEKFEEYNDSIRVKTHNIPGSTYRNEIALGNVPGAEIRPVFGQSIVNDGIENEQALGDGMTGRYPVGLTADTLTIVSDSDDDDVAGIGGRVILIRGNLDGNVEQFETALMDGTTPISTINEFLAVNSAATVVVGSNGKNVGTITVKNGSDLLAQINPKNNLSRTAVFTIPDGFNGLLQGADLLAGKDANGTVILHLHEAQLNGTDFNAFEQEIYQNQIKFTSGPFTATSGTVIEWTAYSKDGTGTSKLSVLMDFEILSIS